MIIISYVSFNKWSPIYLKNWMIRNFSSVIQVDFYFRVNSFTYTDSTLKDETPLK